MRKGEKEEVRMIEKAVRMRREQFLTSHCMSIGETFLR
jgi:hypothetical protein